MTDFSIFSADGRLHPKATTPTIQTHETFITQVAALVSDRLSPADRAVLARIKLVYGAGENGVRGVTYYRKWQNGQTEPAPFVEVGAFAEQDWVQLAGTTLHELAHVLAGWGSGHGSNWKEAADRCGLRRALAGGQSYSLATFDPTLRFAIAALQKPTDGTPNASSLAGRGFLPRPCGQGIGTRGGKSRGRGSGSRLNKVTCPACGYLARVTRKWLDKSGPPHCPEHGAMIEATPD